MVDNKTQLLIVNLEENHPIFQVESKKRTALVKEILDEYYVNQPLVNETLKELNTKIDMLASKMRAVDELLSAFQDIREIITSNKNINHFTKNDNKHSKELLKEVQQIDVDRQLKFDVDAFLDLG